MNKVVCNSLNKDTIQVANNYPFIRDIIKNRSLIFMAMPGILILLLFNYLPMFGVIIAFKNFKYYSNSFFQNLFQSEWIGFKNFEYLFNTKDAFIITRNTLLYNLSFIVIGLIVSIAVALMLNEIRNRKLARIYQTAMFLPFFLSWVVVSYLAYAFLSTDFGYINRVILKAIGMAPFPWYSSTKPWPFLLVFINSWKWCGYNSIIYLSAMIAIDKNYYEAAMIDGASKWRQITSVTLPHIMPVIVMMTLLNLGRIFNADFGLFYQVPRNMGILYPVTNVIDTYVYTALIRMGDIGMSSAAALYQSLVGFILVYVVNRIVRKANKDYALY